MAWLKLEDTFHTHPKFRKLAKRLDTTEAHARGLVAGLWSWTLHHSTDGDLSAFDAEDIAIAAGWSGDADLFVDACRSVGLLDDIEDGLEVHGWMERAGSYKEARRQARKRNKQKTSRDGHGTVQDSHGTVTGQSRTVQDSHGTVTGQSRTVTHQRRGEERRGEERRGEEPSARRATRTKPPKQQQSDPDIPLPPSDDDLILPAVLKLPLIDGSEFGVTQHDIEEWANAYPGVDIELSLRQAKEWCVSNPERRKTRRGARRFITGWLGDDQNKGRNRRGRSGGNGKRYSALESATTQLLEGWANADD